MSLRAQCEDGLLGAIKKTTNSSKKRGKIPSKDKGNPKKSGIFLQITQANQDVFQSSHVPA